MKTMPVNTESKTLLPASCSLLPLQSQEALVSVAIPTYNRPSYLKQAIESAVRQTYRNIEIIVLDNCSPENPQAIINSFQDPRIRFYRNATNLGMARNFIDVHKMARGKYVARLNDDDIWNEDFLEKLVPHLEANPNLVLAFCDHYMIDSDGTINYPATEENTRFYKRHQLQEGVYQPFCEIGLVHQAVASAVAAVIRRDVVDWDNIPPEVGGLWDLYVAYLGCRSGGGAYYYPERLTRNRKHGQTDTMLSGGRDAQAKIRKAHSEIFCYERFLEDEQLQEFKPYFRQKWLHANTTLGIGLLRSQQLAEARPYLLRALSQQKFNLRTIAALILSFTPQSFASKF